MLKLDENGQYIRKLVDRRNKLEVDTYNEKQKELSSLECIFARNAGEKIPTPENFIIFLSFEREEKEKALKNLKNATKRDDLDEKYFEAIHSSYTTEELQKFYNYYLRELSEKGGVVIMPEEKEIVDSRISWGTDEMLEEVENFEKFVEENAKPLSGLPQEIKLLPGDTVGISAPTGSGKTTSLIGIAVKHLNQGQRVLFIALEETELETRARIIRQLANPGSHRNLGFVAAEDFKESTFKTEFASLLKSAEADVVLIDYINDAFLHFDITGKSLQAYEKIKKTVAAISDINHKEVKSIVVIGVQGTAKLLTAKKKEILAGGKAYFEGGQSTIKPLQYAILIQDADTKEDGNEYEKIAYVVKQRNALVKSKSKSKQIGLPTYGMTYDKDQYTYSLIGDLKEIVKSIGNGNSEEPKPKDKASGGRK